MKTVLLAEQDVSEFVTAIGDIIPEAGDYGQVLSATIPQMTGSEILWDPSRAESPFHGAITPKIFPVSILNAGLPVFNGSILSLTGNGAARTVSIGLRSEMQRVLESNLVYLSAAPESPATAFRSICDLFRISYDTDSVSRAQTLYSTNNVTVLVSAPSPVETILQVFQRLTELGVARIYAVDDLLYFDAYNPSADTDSLITISDTQDADYPLLSRPTTAQLEKQSMDGYIVEWLGDVAGTSAAVAGNSQRTISGGQDQSVSIMTRAAALWIGDQWLSYMNSYQSRIDFRIDSGVARSLRLGMPISLDFSEWAEPVLLDIVRINSSGDVFADIAGVTR